MCARAAPHPAVCDNVIEQFAARDVLHHDEDVRGRVDDVIPEARWGTGT